MDLSILTYFVAIADEMSFSSAAEDLFLSQSSLSKRIKKFEQELGVELFVREPHRLSLTPAGKSLLPFARRIAMELDAIRNYVDGNPNEKVMRLRIAAFSLLSTYGVDKFISNLILSHRDIDISVTEMSSDQCLDALISNMVDCCFAYDFGQYSDEEYTSIPLKSERLVALVADDSPLAGSSGITLEQLQDYRIYVPSSYNEPLFKQLLEENMRSYRFHAVELGIWLTSLHPFLTRTPGSISVLPEEVATHYGNSCVPILDAKPFTLSLIFRSDSVLPAFPILMNELEPFFEEFRQLQD